MKSFLRFSRRVGPGLTFYTQIPVGRSPTSFLGSLVIFLLSLVFGLLIGFWLWLNI